MQPQFDNDIDKRAYYKQLRDYHFPNVTSQITDAVNDPLDRPFVASKLAGIPDEFHQILLAEYTDRSHDNANTEANIWLRESIDESFPDHSLSLNATDDDISDYANNRSKMASYMLSQQGSTNTDTVIELLESICRNAGINAPDQKTLMAKVKRVTDPQWWRRRLKKDLVQRREAGSIKMGFVHSKAGLYISDPGLEIQRQSNKRSLEYLQNTEVINELGEVLDLAEIFNSNVSNPKIRFIEMVTRTKGSEEYANQLGLVGIFTTNTCPSRMHARHKNTGRHNSKYDGTTPKQAHQYLGRQWAKTRAELKREGINPLFIRIAEPHHDGTPHWHTLIFVKPTQKDKLIEVMRHYALEHDGNERGAKDSRFKYEAIDPNKGSAVGYVIKYIAKSIDGKGVGIDYESNGQDAADTVERVTAWARTWGIRQFQFSEHCPVTIWRELRKVRDEPKIEAMKPHWLAADEGDFHKFINSMVIAPLTLITEPQQSTRYPDEQIDVIRGVQLGDDFLETRIHTWILRQKSEASAPWTCVNNCTELISDREKIKPFDVHKTQKTASKDSRKV